MRCDVCKRARPLECRYKDEDGHTALDPPGWREISETPGSMVYYKTVCSDECARWLYTTERIVEKVQEMLSGLRMELSRRSP